ncbi:MAG: galactose oxidase [Balneolaceae bacterium]|nr:MAG: galactose oxidase [Balneolaceae bacterium]
MFQKVFIPATVFLLSILMACVAEAQSFEWHPLRASGNAIERHENALVRAGDYFILIGGRGMKRNDIYNTQTKEWSQGAMPPFEIHHIQAVELDGLVYVMGALSGGWPHETPLSHILIYDPVLDLWALGPEIPADRRRGAAGVVVYDRRIYMVCGIIDGHNSGWVNWLDEFDPVTGQWRVLPNAPRSRDHLHAAVINDKLYVAGGRRSGYQSQGFQATVKETDVFDFRTGEWATLPSPDGDIPTERAGTAAAVHQGNILIIGGESGSQQASHDEVEMLDVSSGTWSLLNRSLEGRHGTQAIYFDEMVVVGAGSGNRGGGPELNSFEILAEDANPQIPASSLVKAEITVSSDKVTFSSDQQGETKRLILTSGNGNQASLVTYIQLDKPEYFSIQIPKKTPLILAPGEQVPIEITWDKEGSGYPEANLLIKSLGRTAPLNVVINIED